MRKHSAFRYRSELTPDILTGCRQRSESAAGEQCQTEPAFPRSRQGRLPSGFLPPGTAKPPRAAHSGAVVEMRNRGAEAASPVLASWTVRRPAQLTDQSAEQAQTIGMGKQEQ